MNKEIEELINLFKELQLQIDVSHMSKPDISLFQNINMMIGTYEMVKGQLPLEKLKEIQLAIKQKIREIIEEIRAEAGEEIQRHEKLNFNLDDIDQLLKKPDISIDEMDRLLDEKIDKRNRHKNE